MQARSLGGLVNAMVKLQVKQSIYEVVNELVLWVCACGESLAPFIEGKFPGSSLQTRMKT